MSFLDQYMYLLCFSKWLWHNWWSTSVLQGKCVLQELWDQGKFYSFATWAQLLKQLLSATKFHKLWSALKVSNTAHRMLKWCYKNCKQLPVHAFWTYHINVVDRAKLIVHWSIWRCTSQNVWRSYKRLLLDSEYSKGILFGVLSPRSANWFKLTSCFSASLRTRAWRRCRAWRSVGSTCPANLSSLSTPCTPSQRTSRRKVSSDISIVSPDSRYFINSHSEAEGPDNFICLPQLWLLYWVHSFHCCDSFLANFIALQQYSNDSCGGKATRFSEPCWVTNQERVART